MIKDQVNVVVSGHLGWNGVYWALAPGVHFPCPGGQAALSAAKRHGSLDLQPGTDGRRPEPRRADKPSKEASSSRSGAIDTATGVNKSLAGAIPFVVSSSAGGKFNQGAEPKRARQQPQTAFGTGIRLFISRLMEASRSSSGLFLTGSGLVARSAFCGLGRRRRSPVMRVRRLGSISRRRFMTFRRLRRLRIAGIWCWLIRGSLGFRCWLRTRRRSSWLALGLGVLRGPSPLSPASGLRVSQGVAARAPGLRKQVVWGVGALRMSALLPALARLTGSPAK